MPTLKSSGFSPVPSLMIALVLIAGRPAAARAQSSLGDTLHLSLADVLTQVREGHPVWKAGSAKIIAARARAAERRSTPSPRISVATAALTDVRLELLQPLRWPWEGSALRAVGVQEVAVTTAGVDAARRGVMLDAARSFAEGLRSTRALLLAIEAESLAQYTVNRVAPGNRPGESNDLAALQALVSLDEARRAHVRAQLQHTINQARLALVLGQDPGAPIAFDGELVAIAPLTAPDAALASALATDPNSASLEHDAARADQEARLARARRWPTLELGPALTVGDRSRLGIAIGVSLPAWKRQREAIRAAHAERDTALAAIEVRRRELSALVVDALVSLRRAEAELSLLRGGALARAARALRLAEPAVPQPGVSILTWLAARDAYVHARAAELDLEWQAAEARVLLRTLNGSLIMEEP
ncbi:MAG: TolC family protein [Gemmatimonadales bacterium]